MMDKQYITKRFINTCIREDVYGLLSNNSIIETEFDIPDLPEELKAQKFWLQITAPEQTDWLPITPSDCMQYWQLVTPIWLQKTIQKPLNSYAIKSDYNDFIAVL